MVGPFRRGGADSLVRVRHALASDLRSYVDALNRVIESVMEVGGEGRDRRELIRIIDLIMARELTALLTLESQLLKRLRTKLLSREMRGIIDDLVRSIDDAVMDLEYYEGRKMSE
ncbi:hypothetical protein [Vulcanisaeta thermophila]|uniref:hypothetical protein n=1 Tax=Vulcanisaeta thermophila TaxID=867917 RepID=UPI000852A7F1|nr:hypothetical protein [Vulcanisaeta thermophila]